MYKRWIIEQDSATNTRINWLKRFFTEFEKILTEIGIEFKSYYIWEFITNNDIRSLNCVSSNLDSLTTKGYPEWAINFTSYPNINLGNADRISSWKNSTIMQNYINGFLTFKINEIEYCFVYALRKDGNQSCYSDFLLLVKYNNGKMYSQTIDYKSLGTLPNNTDTDSNTGGIGNWGDTKHVLIEYHKNDYINMLNLTLNGLTVITNGDYYNNGKFISLGTYNLSDDMTMCFPGGFLAKTDNLDSTMFNKICFITDSQGLTTLINGNLGDQLTGEYIKGNVYFGIKNTRILGKIENAITINNYNFETGTIFTYNGHRYGKIKIPMINNEVCVSTDFSKYGAALSLAFHKDIYEDTESN